jgi:hypothetical protein
MKKRMLNSQIRILFIFIFLSCYNCQSLNSSISNSSFNEKSRGPVHYKYSINLFSKLNSTVTLSTFSNSGPTHWKLIKYINETSSKGLKSISLPLYNISNPLIRSNQLIRKEFLCKPTDRICVRLIIPTINFKNIGTYSYQSLINNLDTLYVNYNISLLIDPIEFNCSTIEEKNSTYKCFYNQTTQTMSVPSDSKIRINCSVKVAQNSDFEPAIDLKFDSNLCTNLTITREIIPITSINSTYLNSNDNTNIILFKITKTCIVQFNKEYQIPLECRVIPKIDDTIIPIELTPQTEAYDKLLVSLDIQYGPELEETQLNQNRTLIVGINDKISVNFTCPFTAKPDPIYYWRLAYVSYSNNTNYSKHLNSKSDSKFSMISRTSLGLPIKNRVKLTPDNFTQKDKVYNLPMNLEIGSYIVECKAESSGVVGKVSEPVRFQLNIIRKFMILSVIAYLQ